MDQSDGLAYDQAEAANSMRERTIVENSLVVLLQGLHGQVTTVDLRDESTARGRVVNVDAYMNVRLADVLFRDRRGRVSRLEDLFITGRNVRYVHIPDNLDITDTIEKQLGKISRVRNYAGDREATAGRAEALETAKAVSWRQVAPHARPRDPAGPGQGHREYGLERAACQHPEESLEQSLHTAPLRSSADQKVVETQRHQTWRRRNSSLKLFTTSCGELYCGWAVISGWTPGGEGRTP
ncbi:unnamed protein product [Arctogadus glacialis]